MKNSAMYNLPAAVKAAVLEKPGKSIFAEFPMPELEEGGAICRVLMAGICGTDKHTYRGENVQYKGTNNELSLPFPIIQGHEVVLEIAAISEEGARHLSFDGDYLKVGDRVTYCPDVICGDCWYCKNIPTYPWCDHLQFSYGNMRSCNDAKHLYGGFAEYVYIEPGTRLYKVPEGLPDNIAVLTELMCVTATLDKAKEFNSFSKEGFNYNDTLLIQGTGPLGLCHIIKARMMGAGKIICTDLSDYRLDLAKQFGADIVINADKTTEDERFEIVMQNTGGRGVDLAVECVGYPDVVPEGLRMVRRAGMYLEPGNFVDCGEVPINIHEICTKNLRIIGMCNHTHVGYKDHMEMMKRSMDWFPWDKFVTHVFPLDKYEDAMKTAMSLDSMKVVFAPHGFEK